VKAYQLAIGMRIDPAIPGEPRPIVTDLEISQEGIKIATSANKIFTFSLTDEVAFPRREDGTIRNWVGQTPQLSQLYVGDQVDPSWVRDDDPRNGASYWNPDDFELDISDYRTQVRRDNAAQTITRITKAPGNGKQTFYIYTVENATGRKFRYLADRRIPVHIPHNTWEIPKKKAPIQMVSVQWAGPYRWQNRAQDVMFAIHPSGAGRWPRGIPPYQPGGQVHMQPPKPQFTRDSVEGRTISKQPLLHEWSFWHLQAGGTPHPKDPRHYQTRSDLVESESPAGVLPFRRKDEGDANSCTTE
jgi:hypothetical protein